MPKVNASKKLLWRLDWHPSLGDALANPNISFKDNFYNNTGKMFNIASDYTFWNGNPYIKDQGYRWGGIPSDNPLNYEYIEVDYAILNKSNTNTSVEDYQVLYNTVQVVTELIPLRHLKEWIYIKWKNGTPITYSDSQLNIYLTPLATYAPNSVGLMGFRFLWGGARYRPYKYLSGTPLIDNTGGSSTIPWSQPHTSMGWQLRTISTPATPTTETNLNYISLNGSNQGSLNCVLCMPIAIYGRRY